MIQMQHASAIDWQKRTFQLSWRQKSPAILTRYVKADFFSTTATRRQVIDAKQQPNTQRHEQRQRRPHPHDGPVPAGDIPGLVDPRDRGASLSTSPPGVPAVPGSTSTQVSAPELATRTTGSGRRNADAGRRPSTRSSHSSIGPTPMHAINYNACTEGVTRG